MAEDRSIELPEHVVLKIEKVLGVSPTSLVEKDLVSLVEELCDTALMFDREERSAEPPEKALPVETAATSPPPGPPPVAGALGAALSVSDPGSTAADVWEPHRPDRQGPTASPT